MATAFRNRMPREKTLKAREMRKKLTPAEKALWRRLQRKQTGWRFRRQSIMLGYIADFYCPKTKLVIEVDGGYHQTPKQKAYDKRRDDNLSRGGFFVMRFQNDEIFNDMDRVIEKITAYCEEVKAV